MRGEPKIYRVREITLLVKRLIEDGVGEVWIEGEVSNINRPASGHYYFTIKDEESQIAAVMFRGRQRGLRFQPADGMIVRVFGLVSVYARSGRYQVIVSCMEEGGKGALQAAFEALKKRLLEEGLFDPDRKRSMPLLPRHVGLVTSPTGAAIRDIINVLFRRFENIHVVLAPVRVQGPGAGTEIVEAIEQLNRMGGLDVLIVGRGGGSLEDLWCFNEEPVARAIAGSAIPVISAVGHETDFTISDFAADLRAPTPSAAAELVTGRKADFEAGLETYARRLRGAVQQYLLATGSRLMTAARNPVFLQPERLVERVMEKIMRLDMQLKHGVGGLIRERMQRLDETGLCLERISREKKHAWEMSVHGLGARLRSTNPLAVLDRGYSITTLLNGEVLRHAGRVRKGDRLLTRLAAGKLESEVTGKDDDKKGRARAEF